MNTKILTRITDKLIALTAGLGLQRVAYNIYWLRHRNAWTYGLGIIDLALRTGNYKTVLDAGCGQGTVVTHLRTLGYAALGVDIAAIALPKEPWFSCSRLDSLPYTDGAFNLVFSSEVLEHIPENQVDACISELVRVCNHRLILTISLRPSSHNNAYHVTLRSRQWWQDRFLKHNLVLEHGLIKQLQKQGTYTDYEVLAAGPAAGIIGEMDQFLNSKTYSFNGELEPWFFVFTKSQPQTA